METRWVLEQVGLLHLLRKLDVEGNILRRLPLELCLCTALEELGIALNALEEPPAEVCIMMHSNGVLHVDVRFRWM